MELKCRGELIMAYDNTAARKGQAFNLAVHTAIARGQERNAKFIYKNFIYYLTLADVVQGSDTDLIQKVIDDKNFDELMVKLAEAMK